jgi:type II secretory pathway pseudopilin PulG
MNAKKVAGFTIIEVMLFLAVSGLLAIGILVGSGAAISQQRYRDSVNSLKSFIQQQYGDVTNVVNSRGSQWSCDANANITEVNGVGQPRGTSNCVLLGRYITIDATGTRLTSANVVGYRAAGAPQQTSDIAELRTNYILRVSPLDQVTDEVRWGGRVVRPDSTTSMSFSMLVLRSPLSGSILTFAAAGEQQPQELVTQANIETQHDLCVSSEGGMFGGNQMAVRISAYATNQGAISIPPESDNVCG